MKHVNELASNQAERQSKLEQKSAKVNSAQVTERQRASKSKENPKPDDELLAEIREIKSDLAMLKQQNNSNFVAPSSCPGAEAQIEAMVVDAAWSRRGSAPRMYRGCQIVILLDSPILVNTVLHVGHLTTTRVTAPAFNHRGTGTGYARGTGCNRRQ